MKREKEKLPYKYACTHTHTIRDVDKHSFMCKSLLRTQLGNELTTYALAHCPFTTLQMVVCTKCNAKKKNNTVNSVVITICHSVLSRGVKLKGGQRTCGS